MSSIFENKKSLLAVCWMLHTFFSLAQLPIQAQREIRFTTEEGSYMSVDVSPDGKTLVFDLLGDLYTMPVTGGKATQLTKGIALNAIPVWSPDGKKIAYISDNSGDFRLTILDVNQKRITTLGPAMEIYRRRSVWLFNNDFIAIDNSIYSLTGGKESVPKTLGTIIKSSTDGRFLYSFDKDRISKYDCVNKISEIVSPLLKSVSSKQIALTNNLRWCAYISQQNNSRKLVIQNMQDSSWKIVESAMFAKDSVYGNNLTFYFSFSPDSKHLFVGYGGKIHRINVESGSDKIVPFIANVDVGMGRLNDNTFRIADDPVRVRYIRSANLSPDKKHLVFTALNKMYVMNLSDGKPHVLSEETASQFQPAYSPDGKWISYVTWSNREGGFLWKVSVNGGKPQKIIGVPGNYQHPTWSPDSKQIAVIKDTTKTLTKGGWGVGCLQLVSVNDGAVTIIDTVPMNNMISFTATGGQIIYRPFKDGKLPEVLLSKDLSTGKVNKLATATDLQNPISDGYPSEMSISPNGRFIVYSLGEDLYLLPVSKINVANILTTDKTYCPISVIRFASGMDHYWDRDGKRLNWTYANKFYQIDPNKIIEKAQNNFQKNFTGEEVFSKIVDVEITADQEIPLNVQLPRYSGKGITVLNNVRIITMKGNKVIENGRVLIRDNRIIAVGQTTAIKIPKGAKLVDLNGCTLMPGLIDLHLHVTRLSDFKANLAYGVTTARNPSSNYYSFGVSELLETGQMIGPRLFSSGMAVVDKSWFNGTRCNSLNEARGIAYKRKESGGTFVKQYNQPTRLGRQWLLLASKEAGLNMTNEGTEDPLIQIGMIKDGSSGIEHSPAWGPVFNDVITLFARSRTYLIPTLQFNYQPKEGAQGYFNENYWSNADDKIKRFLINGVNMVASNTNFIYPSKIYADIRKLGGKVGLGSHGEDQGIGAHNELWTLQMGGLTNLEALRAATIMGAEALGIQKDLGSIEVGKIADIIILNKNPLDDIHNTREIRYVMKNGVLYDGNSLYEIWPTPQKRPELKTKNNSATINN